MTDEYLLDRDYWARVEEAAAIVKKSTQTMYRWVASGDIRTMQPGTDVWLYLPDVWATEKRMRRTGMKHKKRGEET